jgi:hypothetical protein
MRTSGHGSATMQQVPAGVAQLAERPSCKRQVSGSIPLTGSSSEHMSILKKINFGANLVPLVQPEGVDSGPWHPSTQQGHRLHRRQVPQTCQGRWRGSVSLGFEADGKRICRRVTGPTKTVVLETMAELREELGRAPRTSRKYTVNEAVADWLDGGLPGRAERTKKAYKEAITPLLAKIGNRPLRELTALEVRKGLESLAPRYSTRYLQIAHNSLERAIRFAQVHQRVSGNVAQLIEVPKGGTGRPSKSLTLARAQDLLKAAEDDRLYAYIVVSLLSGARTEEVRALRWEHVHLDDDEAETVPHIDV